MNSLKDGQTAENIFNEIFQAYHQDVYRFAFHLTQRKEDAEDLFQDAWLNVTKNIHQLSIIRDKKAWIFTITLNRFRDQLRKKRLRSLIRLNSKDASELESRNNDTDWQMSLAQAIAGLPKSQRIIFVLKEMEGFKYEEIAHMLHKPVGTIKSQLHRTLLRLRKELSVREEQYS